LQIQVPENESALVAVDQPVKLTLDALKGQTFEGKISRLSYTLDETMRTMLVEADLPNPDLKLRPGMYANAKLGLEQHKDALLIPVEGLVMEKTNAFVFTTTDGKAKKLPVKLGFNDGTNVEIADGLTADAKVLLVGKVVLTDGQAVVVK
jgi:RND family efflux transporter MFP subunit